MVYKNRVAAIIVALLFGIAVLFSVFFIAAEADHNCAGENCAVCCHIAAYKNILQGFDAAGIVSAVLALGISVCGSLHNRKNVFSRIYSLYTQKELLLN